jgi:hypothetical protein
MVLRSYKNSGRFGKWNWQSDELLKGEKQLRIMGVENATLQTKIAGHIYAEAVAINPDVSTVIVLADENLLQPMMYSLHERISDFNITMGLSMRGSMLFTLIDAIFELQQNIAELKTKNGGIIKLPKFNHRQIFKVLNHPFIRRYEQIKYAAEIKSKSQERTVFRKTLSEILRANKVYLSQDEMLDLGENEPIFKILFSRWGDNPQKALLSFYDLIDELRNVYRDSKDAIETDDAIVGKIGCSLLFGDGVVVAAGCSATFNEPIDDEIDAILGAERYPTRFLAYIAPPIRLFRDLRARGDVNFQQRLHVLFCEHRNPPTRNHA